MAIAEVTFNGTASLTPAPAKQTLQTNFVDFIYEIQKIALMNGEKVDNKKLAKAIGLEVECRVKDEAYDAAYEARIVSVAISRKKKLAIDAIANVVEGKFI